MYATVAWLALVGHTKAACVFTECDVYLEVSDVSLDETLLFDSQAVRACRPDVAVAYWALERKQGALVVRHLSLAVLVEIKRSPSREKVAMDDGLPYNEAGQREMLELLTAAQEQVTNQGALYMRTEAGLEQDSVALVAGAGRTLSYAIMTRTHDKLTADTWKLVGECAELQERKEEEALEITTTPAPTDLPRGTPKLTRPAPPPGEWSELQDVVGEEFALFLRSYLRKFEKMFKEKNPASFHRKLIPK